MARGDDIKSDWARLLWPGLLAAETGVAFAHRVIEALTPALSEAPRPEPVWASPNTIVLELGAARLRRFGPTTQDRTKDRTKDRTRARTPILVCAPFALHDARIADLCEEHSLMAQLGAGGGPLYLVEWLSAQKTQASRRIDDYLADLNVMVDAIGGRCDFVGLCQGGWLSLIYAARFPEKARKLAIAAAPIDTRAGDTPFSALALATPIETYQQLIHLGEGLARGDQAQQFWGLTAQSPEQIHALLESGLPLDSARFLACADLYRAWCDRPLDLPGAYYLEVVDKLYKRNQLAEGQFIALGRQIDLRRLRAPLFLIGARDDEISSPQQTLACARLVGTPPEAIRERIVPGGHLGLFLGAPAMKNLWPEVVAWFRESGR
ncbi:MAG TPA: alpha/beta fold hydrolase [Rhodoblastus sp.]|nr:alpha/beta fold hydrolase [Rhodoblastus sp.]